MALRVQVMQWNGDKGPLPFPQMSHSMLKVVSVWDKM